MVNVRRVAVIGSSVLLLAACSSGASSPSSEGAAEAGGASAEGTETALVDNGTEVTEVGPAASVVDPLDEQLLPDCNVNDVPREPSWPFVVPQEVVPTEYNVQETAEALSYTFTGVAGDGEVALVALMEGAFPGFEVGEPDGSSAGVSVQFDGPDGSAVAVITDDDEDNCWDVVVEASYDQRPALLSDGSVIDSGPRPVDPLDGLSASGTGELISGRGSAQLVATTCSLVPVVVDATSAEGVLEVRSEGEELSATWTHADGVVVVSERVAVLQQTGDALSLVIDGVSDVGPESIVVDLICPPVVES